MRELNKDDMDRQRVESADIALEHALGIQPFKPIEVERPPAPSIVRLAIVFRREARKEILAAAGIEDYDHGAVHIDRYQDAKVEAWLKRTLDSIGPRYG